MSQLSAIDLTIVAVYIVGTTILALVHPRQKDTRTYFVGDRNVAWWLVLISIVATETSTVTFLSIPGKGYEPNGGNLTFLQLTFGYIVGRILIAWCAAAAVSARRVILRIPDPQRAVRRPRAANGLGPFPAHPHGR